MKRAQTFVAFFFHFFFSSNSYHLWHNLNSEPLNALTAALGTAAISHYTEGEKQTEKHTLNL